MIKQGVYEIFPKNLTMFLGWKEAEIRATGKKAFDIQDLKDITEYRCCSSTTDMCKKFWKVMEQLTDEERCLYLKFVWGRARLPVDCRNLSYKHGIEYCEGR